MLEFQARMLTERGCRQPIKLDRLAWGCKSSRVAHHPQESAILVRASEILIRASGILLGASKIYYIA
jgi:hypothetical protein